MLSLSSQRGSGGLTCLILPLPVPCAARMCQPHTSSRCRGGCLCVRSTGLHTSRAAIAVWSGYTQQTLNDLWLAGSSKGPGLWPLCAAAAAAAGWPRSLLQSNISKKKKTTDYGRSEFIMKKQASQFPYRPIFNISDRCLFSVSNQIVYFSCLCPQLFKNISLTPSLPLIHHSTYRGHEEVSVWVVFLCFLLCDISLLI